MHSRSHTSTTLDATWFGANGDGCAIWFPDFTGDDASPTQPTHACFFTTNDQYVNAADTFVNTVATPLGNPNSKLSTWQDPAFPYVESDIVKDFRTTGACLALGYTGALANCQGEVTMTRVQFNDIFQVSGDGTVTPNFTVNSLFQYSGRAERFTSAGVEIVWTPDERSHEYADEQSSAFAPLQVEVPASVASHTDSSMSQRNPTALVIAWRGLNTTEGVTLKTTKSYEWRPKTISGLTHVAPVTVAAPSITSRVKAAAESSGWLERTGDALAAGATSLFKGAANVLGSIVYSGVSGYAAGSARPLRSISALPAVRSNQLMIGM